MAGKLPAHRGAEIVTRDQLHFENPEFQKYDARLHGAVASVDDDGNVHMHFPEERDWYGNHSNERHQNSTGADP
jgi:hypothetical protein